MEKGLRKSPPPPPLTPPPPPTHTHTHTKALISERNPQSDKKTKQLKPKFASKTALEKSPTKQNKTKTNRETQT